MAEGGDSVLRVMMPPEFEYLGGLFLPDLDRARLAARAASAVAQWRRRGYPVQFDPGCGGLTAGQTASLLVDNGSTRAVVIGGGHDRTGADILHQALAETHIQCPTPLLSTTDGADIFPQLQQAVDGLPKTGNPIPDPDTAAEYPCPALLITDGKERPPTRGVTFEAEGRGLRRVSGGRAGSVPPWITRIKMIHPGAAGSDRVLNDPAGDEGTVIYGLSLPAGEHEMKNVRTDWLQGSSEFIERTGVDRCRLVCATAHSLPQTRCGGAPWAVRYGIDHPSLRGALLELVSGCLPEWLGLLHTVIGLYETCADPLEEMYAGNGLADRNAELIENIVT